MKIIGYDPYVSADSFSDDKITVVDFDTLIKESDYITLHLPINNSTRNLFTIKQFKMMKSSAKIINVARGGIINEKDLCEALDNNLISGAAIDVFEKEPLDNSSPLINCKNILLTPHLGASTFEAKEGVTLSICNQVIKYFQDNQLNNAINIPISDISLINKLKSYYELSELMGLIQSQLAEWPVSSVKVFCYGTAEDSKSIGLAVLKGLLSNITDNRINFINASTIAKERSISFSHLYSNDDIPYLNVIEVQVESQNQTITLSGSVFSENHIRIIFEPTDSYQLSLVHEAVESAFKQYADLQKEKDKFSDRINNALVSGIIETGGTDFDSKNERLKAKILSYFCSHRNF